MQAAILIGGLGTRLGGAVRSVPKPLLEVAGRPFVAHIIANLNRYGFDNFVLLAGHQAEVVLDTFGPQSDLANSLQGNIRVVVEPEPLGTAGALKFAQEYLQPEFLLVNGDSIFDFNYLDLCNCIRDDESDDWLGRVALLRVDDASRYGLVELGGTRIQAFREKPRLPQPGLINSGVYWLKSGIIDLVGQTPCSLENDIFPGLVGTPRLVGRVYDGFFIDIGIPEDLHRARQDLASDLSKPAAFLDRDGTLNWDEGYTHRIEDFRWVDGAREAIKKLNDAGCLVFVVTNQAGIARGFYEPRDVEILHQWMQSDLANIGAHIDDFRYCPHHPDGSIPSLSIACDCRKPGTAMLESLIRLWHPDIRRSVMLGDSQKDYEAGLAAGIESHIVETGSILQAIEQYLDMIKKPQRKPA